MINCGPAAPDGWLWACWDQGPNIWVDFIVYKYKNLPSPVAYRCFHECCLCTIVWGQLELGVFLMYQWMVGNQSCIAFPCFLCSNHLQSRTQFLSCKRRAMVLDKGVNVVEWRKEETSSSCDSYLYPISKWTQLSTVMAASHLNCFKAGTVLCYYPSLMKNMSYLPMSCHLSI